MNTTNPGAKRPPFDITLGLAREGYRHIGNTCDRLGTDAFPTRVALQPAVCLRGEAGVRLFYDEKRFLRGGVLPKQVQKTLTGEGAIQGLDLTPHKLRKAAFMMLMGPAQLRALVALVDAEWSAAAARWESAGEARTQVFLESQRILCRAVCAWSGVPVAEADAVQRSDDLALLIDGVGALGPKHYRARAARKRLEDWIAGLVEAVRAKTLAPGPVTALRVMAEHRDEHGALLDARIAAVEVINVLRPTVAISTYIAFCALALHAHPEARQALQAPGVGSDALERFAQEVRRHYPFFPFATARVRESFEWRGIRFAEGAKVLLDLYGTNHDPARYTDPQRFAPERFATQPPNPYNLVPQGGGEHHVHHRCAGEWLTIEVMKLSSAWLARGLAWELPPQDLRYSPKLVPTRPKDGFVVTRVRRTAEGLAAGALLGLLADAPRLQATPQAVV